MTKPSRVFCWEFVCMVLCCGSASEKVDYRLILCKRIMLSSCELNRKCWLNKARCNIPWKVTKLVSRTQCLRLHCRFMYYLLSSRYLHPQNTLVCFLEENIFYSITMLTITNIIWSSNNDEGEQGFDMSVVCLRTEMRAEACG